MNRKTAHHNHRLGIFSQDCHPITQEVMPPRCYWQGCGNVQASNPRDTTYYTGDHAGRAKRESSYKVFLPNNQYVRNAVKQGGFYIVDLDERALEYGALYHCQGSVTEHGIGSCWLQVTCHIEACSNCTIPEWCDAASTCPNGVVVEYDFSCPLCEFLNCQTEGTTVCLPTGTYPDDCDVSVVNLCIVPSTDAVVEITGQWTVAQGVKVFV